MGQQSEIVTLKNEFSGDCDYYENLYLRIEYAKGELNTAKDILLNKKSHWLYTIIDSDSEDAYDKALEKEICELEENYGRKIIYEDDEYKITSKEKIKKYNNIAQKYLPENGKILRIFKYVSCITR